MDDKSQKDAFRRRLFLTVAALATLIVTTTAQVASSGGLFRFQKKANPLGIFEGSSSLYTVKLLVAPTDDITLSFRELDTQLNVQTTRLIFTAQNWSNPRELSLQAVDDNIIQESPYGSVIEVSSNSESHLFNSSRPDGLQTNNLTVLIIEADQAGVIITRKDVYPSPVYLPEGRSGVYNIQLRSRPSQAVAISFTAINSSLISVSPTVLVFQPENWNVSQELTVNALEDKVDRVSPYSSQFGMELSSTDTNFHNLTVSDYPVTIEDNDDDQSVVQGSLSWKKQESVGRTTAILNVELTLDLPSMSRRRSVNENISVDARLSFGDGTADIHPLTLTVTSVHDDLGYLVAQAKFRHSYREASNGGAPWTASVEHCCRRDGLRNNAGSKLLLHSHVDLSDTGSPLLPTLPVIALQSGPHAPQPQAVLLSAIAPYSHPVHWEFADRASYGSVRAGTPQGLKIDSASGRLSWDTSSIVEGSWTALVNIQDIVTGASSATELVLQLKDAAGSPSINNNSALSAISRPRPTLYVAVSDTLTINITAEGSNPTVVPMGPLPAGAVLSPAVILSSNDSSNISSVHSSITWQPQSSQLGGHTFCVLAKDSDALLSTPQCHSVMVSVSTVTQPPVVDLNGALPSLDYATSFHKGTTSSVAIADSSAAIISNGQLQLMVIQMINAVDTPDEHLVMTAGFFNPSITLRTIGSSLVLQGAASAVEYTGALKRLHYVNHRAIPSVLSDRLLVVTLFDSANIPSSYGSASPAVTTVQVAIDNQVPVVRTSSNSATYQTTFLPGLGPVAAVDSIQSQVTDIDSVYLNNVSVSLGNIGNPLQEYLQTTFKSPETVSLPRFYQSEELDLRFGRTWLPEDRLRGSRHPTGPDVPSVSSAIAVNDNFTIGQIDVIVTLGHSWVGDLLLELVHNGIRQTLVSRPGGQMCSQDNLQGTVFSSSASRDALLSSSPTSPGLCKYEMRGVFAPEGNLSLFSGGSAHGSWELHVTDLSLTDDNGQLTGWALLLQPLEAHFVASAEPSIPTPELGGSITRLEHSLSVVGSGGKISGLSVKTQLFTAIANSNRGFMPTLILQHPDGSQVTLLNCSSSSCPNSTKRYDFMVFNDNATETPELKGPCCPSSVVTVSLSSAFLFANNSLNSTAEECQLEKNNLVDIVQPADTLSQLYGKPVDGEWKLIFLLPSLCSDSQTVHLQGWSLQIAREPNIDTSYDVSSGVLVLSGQDTPAYYTSMLRSIVYNNLARRADFSTPRQVVVTAFDGAVESDSSLVTSQSRITVHHIDLDLDPLNTTSAATPHMQVKFVEEREAISLVDRTNAQLRDAFYGKGRYVLTVTLHNVANFGYEDVYFDTSKFPFLDINRTADNSSAWIRHVIHSTTGLQHPINAFESVLRSAEYLNTAEELSGATRQVDFSVQDMSLSGLFFSVTASCFVTMVPVNDPPALDLNRLFSPLGSISNVVEYEEGQGPVLLANTTAVLLYDYDDEYLESITISFARIPDTSIYEVLSADTSGTNIVALKNISGNSSLQLVGHDTIANYTQVLETVSYTNNKHGTLIGHPSTAQRLISFVPNDGTADGTAAVVDVTFVAVNDEPLLDLNGAASGIDFAAVFTEERGEVSVVDIRGLTAFDVDNDSLSYASVRIENVLDEGDEILTADSVTQRISLTPNGKVISETTLRPKTTFNFSNGELIITGLASVAEYQSVLRTVRYNNMADEPSSAQRRIIFVLNDGLLKSPPATTIVNITLVNDSPFFNYNPVVMPTINEDVSDASNPGVSLDTLSGLMEDDDVGAEKGVAVVSVDNRNGVWQYLANSTWSVLTSTTSYSQAVLLRALPDNAVRFVPNRDFHGNTSLTFLAWDTTGPEPLVVDGSVVNASTTSNINPFSNTSRTIHLSVAPVNDAPVLSHLAITLSSILEDDRMSAGDSVQVLLANVIDVDLASVKAGPMGVAVVETDESDGFWQYSQNGGRSWLAVSRVSRTGAFLLPADQDGKNRIRFWPLQDFNGEVTLVYHAWDMTMDQVTDERNLTTLNASANVDISTSDPVTGAYSINNNTASLTVIPVNDSPVLGTNISLFTIFEDVPKTLNHGTLVGDIVGRDYTDVDVNYTVGVAVVGIDERFGEWQYSCNTTQLSLTWMDFVGDIYFDQVVPPLPRQDKATLLADYCRIRFLPNHHFNTEYNLDGNARPAGDIPFIRLLGWDQTTTIDGVGRYAVDASAASASIINEFSSDVRTALIEVASINDVPILHLNGSVSKNYETTFVEDLLGILAVGSGLELVDNDHALLQSTTIQILNMSAMAGLSNISPDWNDTLPDNSSDDEICNGNGIRRQKLLVDLSSTNLEATVRSYCPYVLEISAIKGSKGAPVSHFQKALRTMVYNNSLEEPNPADRLIVVSVLDGVGWSKNVYTLLHIQLVNDAPILDLNGPASDNDFFVNYTEGEVAVPLVNTTELTLIDHDDNLLQWARLQLNDAPDNHHELLNVTLSGTNITAEFNVQNNTLLLTGIAPVADYEVVLQTATYTNTFAKVGFPSDRDRRVDITVSDGKDISIIASAYIYFTRVNDRPFLDLNGAPVGQDFATTFREEMGVVSLCAPDVQVFDIDNGTLAFVTVEITNIKDGASEVLSVSRVVESTVESYNTYSQEKVLRRTTLTPNVTYNATIGLMVIRGLDSLNEYAKVLGTLTYNNLKDEPDTVTRLVRISLNDGLLESVHRTTTVAIVPINDSPRLSTTDFIIHPLINEDVPSIQNAGFSVHSMATPLIEDDDSNSMKGVAIVAVNNSFGTWQYQTTSSFGWVDIPSSLDVSLALLLQAKASNLLRFMPSQDYHGPSTLRFVAWDGSDGMVDGDRTNATSASPLDAFSDASRVLETTVVPVNDAPLLNRSVSLKLTTIREDSVRERNNTGDAVSLLLQAWGGDVDVPVVRDRGVAITAVDNRHGYWQFTTNSGNVWRNMGSPTETQAVVLGSAPAGENRFRFVPNKDFNGLAWLQVKMWDRNSSHASGTISVNTRTDPTTGTFSIATSNATLVIEPVNDSPVLTANSELFAIPEDPSRGTNLGTTVGQLIKDIWVDVDGLHRGIAITGIYNGPQRSYGEWQYSCDIGNVITWQPLIGDQSYNAIHPRDPLPEKATLLVDTCRTRFAPVENYNTEYDLTGARRSFSDRPHIHIRGWDGTGSARSGTYGVNTISSPDDHTNEFSENITFAYITVNSRNDVPVLRLDGNTSSDYSTVFVEAVPPLCTVFPVPAVGKSSLTLADIDNASLSRVTISMVAPDTTTYESLQLDTRGSTLTVQTLGTNPSLLQLSLQPLSSSAASVLMFQSVLRTLTYANSAEEPNPTTRSVSFVALDGVGFSQVVQTQVIMQLVNDPPELDLDTRAVGSHSLISYSEGDGAVLLADAALQLVDHDSRILDHATVAIRQAPDADHEVLAANTTQTAIRATFNNSQLTLQGPDSVANFEAVLQTITYSNTFHFPGNPDGSTREIVFIVNDGQNDSIPATSFVTFTAVNDKPVLDLNGNSSGIDHAVEFREQEGPVKLTSKDLFIIEIDNTTLLYATVQITNLIDGLKERLHVENVREYSDVISAELLTVKNIYPKQVYDNTTGMLHVSGLKSVAEYEKVLRTLTYNNMADEPDLTPRRIEFILSDGHLKSSPVYTTVTMTSINDSPYFTNKVPANPEISEDLESGDNSGISVEEFLEPLVGDDDNSSALGLAITQVDVVNGYWQYTLDYNSSALNSTQFNATDNQTATATWQRVPDTTSASSSLLLLARSEETRLRFVSNQDFNGNSHLKFVAWDASDGRSDGDIVDSRSMSLTDPFSNSSRQLTITVLPVNDAPILSITSLQLTTIFEDDRASRGDSVQSLVQNVTDVDASLQEFGVAIVMTDDNNGTWEITTDGSTWISISNISRENAVLLRSEPPQRHRIRFSPSQDFHGTASFEYVAWDLSNGLMSGSMSVNVAAADPVTGPYSVASATATITVDPVNDSPVLLDGAKLLVIAEDLPPSDNNGTLVRDIVHEVYYDVDFDSKPGIAVIGVDERFGKWQYRCPQSSTWLDFIGDYIYRVVVPKHPRPEKATLLAGDCRVRFLPILNFNTLRNTSGDLRPDSDRPQLTIRGWDGTGTTTGRSGQYGQDSTMHNASKHNEFSTATVNATIDISSVNDLPVISLSSQQSSLLFKTDFTEDDSFVRIVDSSLLTLTDSDHAWLEKITVTLAIIYNFNNETIESRPPTTSPVRVDASGHLATVQLQSGTVETLQLLYQVLPVESSETQNVSASSQADNTNSSNPMDNSTSSATSSDNSTDIGNSQTNNTADARENSTSTVFQGVLVISSGLPGKRVSVEAYEAVLRTLVYVNTHREPNNTLRHINFAIDDSEDVNRLANTEVRILLLEDNAPHLTLTNMSFVFVENQTPAAMPLTIDLKLTDNDHNVFFNMVNAIVTLQPPPDSIGERLRVDQSLVRASSLKADFNMASGKLLISGSAHIDRYQEILQSVHYQNDESEPRPGARIVSLEVVDSGGLHSNVEQINITMTLINDRVPQVSIGGPFQVTEHPNAPTNIASGLRLSDADSGGFLQERVTVVITNGHDGEFEQLSVGNVSSAITVNSSLYRLELEGPASVDEFNLALSNLSYINTAEEPNPEDRKVMVEVFDGSQTSVPKYITIGITLTNDLPVVDLNGGDPDRNLIINYVEGSGAVSIVSHPSVNKNETAVSVLTLKDNDHDTLVYARVKLMNRPDQPQELLSANKTSANITVSYSPQTGVLWLNGTDTLAAYQEILRTVTYENSEALPGFPDTQARRVLFVVSDGEHVSLASRSLVTFQSVNDAPIVDLDTSDPTSANYTTVFTEEAGSIAAVDISSTVEDIDSPFLHGLTVRIVNYLDVNKETLSLVGSQAALNNLQNSTSDFNITSGVLTVDGNGSLADYQTLLRSVRYDNTADEPVFTTRSLEVIAYDGDKYSEAVFSSVQINPVNDLPRLTIASGLSGIFNTQFIENGVPVSLVENDSLLIEDDDDDFLTELTVELLQEADPGFEALFFDVTSLPLSFSTSDIGDFSSPSCPPFGRGNTSLQIIANYSLSEWETLLSSLRYCDSDEHPVSGVRQVNITLQDPSGASTGPRQARVRVQHINDPPFFLPQNATFVKYLNEDQNVTVSVLHTFSDHEEKLTGVAIRIVEQPAKGQVVVNESTGSLQFYPAANDIGSRYVLYKACDSEGNCSDVQNLTFILRGINDPPQPIFPLTLEVHEDSQVSVDLSRYFSDAEDDLVAGSIYPRIEQLTATPRKGNWDLNVNRRNFTFRPSPNDYGRDELNFTVCDSVQLCTDMHITIIIIPVNDLPTGKVILPTGQSSAHTVEDAPVRIAVQIEDQEDRSDLSVTVVSVVHGTAKPDMTNQKTQVIGDRNVFRQDLHILFTPEKDYNGEAWLVFAAQDKDNGTVFVRANITIFAENDPPVFGLSELFTKEDEILTVPLPRALQVADKEENLTGSSISLLTNSTIGVVTYTTPQTGDGTLTYIPPLNFFSTSARRVNFTMRVCDNDIANKLCVDSVITINVTPVNDVPPAPAISEVVNEEESITFDVHKHMTDVEDGKPPIGNIALDLSSTRKGTATYDSTTGYVTYQTNPGAFGSDVVLYRVCDSEGACNTSGVIRITISPFNDAPVARSFIHSAREDDFDLISIYNRVSDNDTSSARAVLLAELKISVIDSSGNYVARAQSQRGGELRVYQAHGIITYQAPNNYVGPDSFNYSVCDRCDPRRNFELGRLQVTDPACLRQLEANSRSYLKPNSNVYITCGEARVDILVGNVNDVPTVRDISVVTREGVAVVLSPIADSIQGTRFSDPTKPVYDRDDAQAIVAAQNGLNLAQYNLSATSDLNSTWLNIPSPGPTRGSVVNRFTPGGIAELVYTPHDGESGYDSFDFEVCDKKVEQVKVATCNKAKARVLINSVGPKITKIIADALTEPGTTDSDSKFSRDDVIKIYFDKPTNTPPRGTAIGTPFPTEDVDSILVFNKPFINPQRVQNRYQGTWLNTTLLELKIIDEGYPQPNVSFNIWKLGVKPGTSPCNGFDPTSHQILPDTKLNKHCLTTADGFSLHASTVSPPLQGNFGETIPIVSNIIYRNTGVDDQVLLSNENFFGQNSELLLYLEPPLSQPQLTEYCNYPAEEILNYKTDGSLGVDTVLDVSGCANLLTDGQNAEQVYQDVPNPSASPLIRLDQIEAARKKRATGDTKTVMPVVSQISFRVKFFSSLVSPSSADFLNRVRNSLSDQTLRKVIFRKTTTSGIKFAPVYTPSIFQQQRDDNTPSVEKMEASDPDNGDTIYGAGDVVTITFDRDTDTPPVATKADIDKVMKFKPVPLGRNYIGRWTTLKTLVLTVTEITDDGVPAIGSLSFTFQPNFIDSQRNLTANNQYLPTTKPNCIGINVCGTGSGNAITVGVCAQGSGSCRAAGDSPTLTGSWGTGAGVSSSQSLWWISIIVLLLVIVLGIIIYLLHRRHKQEAFRKEAMRWVRRWQSDADAPGKDKPKRRPSSGGPSDSWNRPPSMSGMRPVPDPFSNLPEVSSPEPPPQGAPTFLPRQPASIDEADPLHLPPGLRRPSLPTSLLGEMQPPPSAPVVLPPLKPPALRMGPPGHLPPISGATTLPPLRPGLLPDNTNVPSPPSSPRGDTALRPARKRVRNVNIDSESSGMFENVTATESGTAMSSTAESGSDPTLDKPGNGILPARKFVPGPLNLTDTAGPPPLRAVGEPRPLISPRASSRGLPSRTSFPVLPLTEAGSPTPGSPTAALPSSPTNPVPTTAAMPRPMRRPSQIDPFSAPLPRQLSRQFTSESLVSAGGTGGPGGMSRPTSRAFLSTTGRTFSKASMDMELAAAPRGPLADAKPKRFPFARDGSQDGGQ